MNTKKMTATTTAIPANLSPEMVPELPPDSPFSGGEGKSGGGGDDLDGGWGIILDVDEPNE